MMGIQAALCVFGKSGWSLGFKDQGAGFCFCIRGRSQDVSNDEQDPHESSQDPGVYRVFGDVSVQGIMKKKNRQCHGK